MTKFKLLLALLVCLGIHLTATPAHAVAYQGTYVIIDPYNTQDMGALYSASGVGCPQTSPLTSPFCGASSGTQPVNGIYLRIQWCSFQLYYGASSPPAGCHYTVIPSTGGGSTAYANPDNQSTCNTVSGYTYDTCSSSILYTALSYIVDINTKRASAGLPKLQLSIGLEAGAAVPLSYILSGSSNYVGYVDLPAPVGASYGCVRLPNVWTNTYISGYDAALDELISVINSYDSSALNNRVKIVKVTPITSLSNEFDMAGRYVHFNAPTDPGTITNQGPSITCPGTGQKGAQTWLSDYNALYNSSGSLPDCNYYASFAQATECVVGSSIGHIAATLKNASMLGTIMSIPNNAGAILPDINCGTSLTSTCAVMSAGDQWSVFYFYQYITDLFSSGTVAYSAASNAYTSNGGTGTFSLPTSSLSTTWTALTVDPTNSTYNFFTDSSNPLNATNQVTCALNNTTTGHAVTYTLNGSTYPTTGGLVGPGIIIGWQTQTNQGSYCSLPSGSSSPSTYYDYIMNSGWANSSSNGNGQFIEVEPDAAFTNLPACAAQLTLATTSLQANTASTSTCPYP